MTLIESFYQNLKHGEPMEQQILDAQQRGIIISYTLTTKSTMNARRDNRCLWCDETGSVDHNCEYAPDFNCMFTFGEEGEGVALVKVPKRALKPLAMNELRDETRITCAHNLLDKVPDPGTCILEDNAEVIGCISNARSVFEEMHLPEFIREMAKSTYFEEEVTNSSARQMFDEMLELNSCLKSVPVGEINHAHIHTLLDGNLMEPHTSLNVFLIGMSLQHLSKYDLLISSHQFHGKRLEEGNGLSVLTSGFGKTMLTSDIHAVFLEPKISWKSHANVKEMRSLEIFAWKDGLHNAFQLPFNPIVVAYYSPLCRITHKMRNVVKHDKNNVGKELGVIISYSGIGVSRPLLSYTITLEDKGDFDEVGNDSATMFSEKYDMNHLTSTSYTLMTMTINLFIFDPGGYWCSLEALGELDSGHQLRCLDTNTPYLTVKNEVCDPGAESLEPVREGLKYVFTSSFNCLCTECDKGMEPNVKFFNLSWVTVHFVNIFWNVSYKLGSTHTIFLGGYNEDEDSRLFSEKYGYLKSEKEEWISCITIFYQKTKKFTSFFEYGETVIVGNVNFHDQEKHNYGVPITLSQFHIMGVISSLQKTFSIPRVTECSSYGTIMESLGSYVIQPMDVMVAYIIDAANFYLGSSWFFMSYSLLKETCVLVDGMKLFWIVNPNGVAGLSHNMLSTLKYLKENLRVADIWYIEVVAIFILGSIYLNSNTISHITILCLTKSTPRSMDIMRSRLCLRASVPPQTAMTNYTLEVKGDLRDG